MQVIYQWKTGLGFLHFDIEIEVLDEWGEFEGCKCGHKTIPDQWNRTRDGKERWVS